MLEHLRAGKPNSINAFPSLTKPIAVVAVETYLTMVTAFTSVARSPRHEHAVGGGAASFMEAFLEGHNAASSQYGSFLSASFSLA